jgi:hypothetical protein
VAGGGLLLAKLEVLGALECQLHLGLALLALETDDDLLGGLRLLVEDGLGLPAEALLLVVVSALACRSEGGGRGGGRRRAGGCEGQ